MLLYFSRTDSFEITLIIKRAEQIINLILKKKSFHLNSFPDNILIIYLGFIKRENKTNHHFCKQRAVFINSMTF